MVTETVLNNYQSTGIFIIVISILIIVHEWGHFITAKKLGVKVEKFSLGFGPKLFSKVWHGTEYLVSLIPLGGYVKMAGDEKTDCKGASDEFYSKSPGYRALIVLNGPIVNFIWAYICLFFVFILGYPDLSTKVGELLKGYPAEVAGLQAGDKILQIGENKIDTWSDVQKNILEAKEDNLQFRIVRNGVEIEKTVIAKSEARKNIFGQVKNVRIIGIRPAEEIIAIKYGFGVSFIKAYEKLAEITSMTLKALYFMVTGSMSPKESMTGPVGIFFVIKAAAELGFAHLLYILGVISASLAIFNLLPVIPLDGGHLLLLGIEKIRGKTLSLKTEEMIGKIGFSLIILLAVFVFYNDFLRFGIIEKAQGLLNKIIQLFRK